MSETPTFKPKKSVALSGTPAGNTALCTVGHSGNDLHYRGYDIKDLAANCEFEEVAYLLVHGKLPNRAELAAYKAKLKALRGLPAAVKEALELLPASAHPMDVLRTGVSVLGCIEPEGAAHDDEGARAIADRLLACLGSMLCYWLHFARNGKRIEVEGEADSIAGHFLELLHGVDSGGGMGEDAGRQAAEELEIWAETDKKHTSVAKATVHSVGFIPGMNPRPTARTSFSAACKVVP